MSPDLDPACYVVVWREPPSIRLRTYVDEETTRPLAIPLSDIHPLPSVIDDEATLDELLQEGDFIAAIREDLVTHNLGWDVTRRVPTATA